MGLGVVAIEVEASRLRPEALPGQSTFGGIIIPVSRLIDVDFTFFRQSETLLVPKPRISYASRTRSGDSALVTR